MAFQQNANIAQVVKCCYKIKKLLDKHMLIVLRNLPTKKKRQRCLLSQH